MHKNGYAHRDLSPENVLIDSQGNCKICDFGLVAASEVPTTGTVGKLFYMAPEVYAADRRSYVPKMADMWSLGALLFVMSTGIPLVDKPSVEDSKFQFFDAQRRASTASDVEYGADHAFNGCGLARASLVRGTRAAHDDGGVVSS